MIPQEAHTSTLEKLTGKTKANGNIPVKQL